MSPAQYRALERLRDAPALIATGMDVPPSRIHPRTADALVRRGLARRSPMPARGEELLTITGDGRDLLAARPTPADR